jgi:hypothetical protein
MYFFIFFFFQGLVNDKESKDSMTEGENLEEDEEEEEGGAETEEQSGNESEVNEAEEEVMTFIYTHRHMCTRVTLIESRFCLFLDRLAV